MTNELRSSGARRGLVGLFRDDHALAWLTVLLALSACLPILFTPFVPLKDLPDHVALASQIPRILGGEGLAARMYRLQLVPTPYLTTYAFLAALKGAVGAFWAAKALVALCVIVVPLGTMRLLGSLNRSPRLGLLAFTLAWNNVVIWGFCAFVLGFGLMLFVLARLIEADGPKQALRAWPLAGLVALTNPHAAGLLVIYGMLAAVAREPLRRRVATHAVGLAAVVGVLFPWGLSVLTSGNSSDGSFAADIGEPVLGSARVASLFPFTFGGIAVGGAHHLARFAFFVLLFVPPVLAVVGGSYRRSADRAAWLLYLASWAMYLVLPTAISWPMPYAVVYDRHAPFLLIVGLLLPGLSMSGVRSFLLIPGIASALALNAAVASQFAAFGRESAPFVSVIDAVPPDRAVLTLPYENWRGDGKGFPVFDQFHAYIVAAKGGYDPMLFDHAGLPVVRRSHERLRWPLSLPFLVERDAAGFDYVLVQGLSHDPVVPGVHGDMTVSKVAELARWRLYKVVTLP